MLQLKENVADIMKSHDILSDMKSYHEWQRDYFNFFAQEIYDREPLTIQQFMVDCSVIELSNEGVCTALTKRRDAGTILQDLEKRNTFLFRTPDNNYRFHNLFREFLLSKLRDPKRKKRIFLSAAQYFSKTRQQEYAADYYLEAGYYKEVAKIIRKIGCDLTNRGKSNTVCAYIEKLPMKMVNQEPDLLMVYGYALMLNGYPNEAAKNLRRAAKILQKQPRSSDKCSRVFYELASIHFITGNDRLAMKWLKKALAVRPKKKEITYVDILNSLGILYSRMGVKKFGDAIDYFKKALQIVKKLPENRDVEATIYNNWAMTEQKAGNLNAANELSFKAIKILKKEEYFAAQSGITFSSAAWLSLHLGDVDRAYSVLELGSHISKKYNDIYSLAMLWQGYAWYYEALCDFHQAKACLKKTIDFFEEMKFKKLTQRAYRDLCLINIRLGLLAEAEHSLSKSWAIKKTRDDAQAVPLLLAEARLRIAQNRASHAENILTYSLKLANKYGKVLERFYILLDLAMVLHKKRRTAETINVLNQALDVSKEKGYEYLLARTMKQQQWMIELLLRTDKKYVFSVLQQSSIPYHLVEVSLFGRPRVTVDGMKIDPGLWQTSKAMKLFCYLCLSKEKTLSRDTLIDSLWKDTPLHKSSKSLRKAVHNIRKAFKSVTVTEDSPVIYKDGLYKISSNFSVRVDVEEFIRAVKQAKDVEHDYKALKAQIKGVTHLYQDGMAKGWFDEWVDEMRAHYSHVYEEYLLMFVDHSIKNNDYKESVVWLQKLIENNFFEEEYHRKLWAAYARLKKYKEIREDFLNLKERFKSELKDKLQPETIELYNFLVK